MPMVMNVTNSARKTLAVSEQVSSTLREDREIFADAPERFRDDLRKPPRVHPDDEFLVRAYVSRLWAEDWDTDSDSVYDTP